MGKTRLATEVLARAGSSFPDGTTFVDLSAVRDPAVVLPRVATALGVVEGVHSAGLADRLAAHLAGRRVLVVLDNVEQVLAAAPAVADLLARAPGLTVVATSRAPLRVRAEREVPVGPLALPEDDDPASVSASPAVSVFLDRAAATGVQWAVTPETAATLAGIARRLDGLPLALELAAAGARVLPPEALLARLEKRGLDPGLGHGPRDLPDRQRTMTTVLDWSADLLEPEEWDLLMRLSVFSGGFSLDSVEAVVGGSGGAQGSDDVLPALTSLVEQSLVVPVLPPDPIARFRLLEPVRQYAAVQAQAAGVALPTAEAHAAHFRALAVEAHRRLRSRGIGLVLDRLEADHANLRSAYLRLLELDRHADAAELAMSLWLHLGLRGYAREGLGWLDRLDGAGSDAAVVRAAVARMGLMLVVGDVAGMRREAAVALPLARRVGDPTVEGEAMVLAGLAAVFAGDLDAASDLLRPDLQLPDGDAERWISLHFLIGLGQAALVGGAVDDGPGAARGGARRRSSARQRVHPGDHPQHRGDAARGARRRHGRGGAPRGVPPHCVAAATHLDDRVRSAGPRRRGGAIRGPPGRRHALRRCGDPRRRHRGRPALPAVPRDRRRRAGRRAGRTGRARLPRCVGGRTLDDGRPGGRARGDRRRRDHRPRTRVT